MSELQDLIKERDGIYKIINSYQIRINVIHKRLSDLCYETKEMNEWSEKMKKVLWKNVER